MSKVYSKIVEIFAVQIYIGTESEFKNWIKTDPQWQFTFFVAADFYYGTDLSGYPTIHFAPMMDLAEHPYELVVRNHCLKNRW